MGYSYKDKNILITGGTGSLGQTLVNFLLSTDVDRIIVFSRDELKQFEMSQKYQDHRLRYFVGDVRDKDRLTMALNNVDYIIHTAALKQVPSCEYNPFEAVKTNVIGSQNIIEAAIEKKVKKVLAVSTDKAVAPLNLYGATKACAEKLFVAGNSYAGGKVTKFSIVRYGNVVNSRGSVIPFFKEKAKSGILPITDVEMTRFWITMEEAIKLIFNSLNRMSGGEVFVPKIPSMKVMDLAKAICPKCKFEIVGIRPGEKIHEVLITNEEARRTFSTDCYIIYPEYSPWDKEQVIKCNVDLDFEYASHKNEHWMSEEELREII